VVNKGVNMADTILKLFSGIEIEKRKQIYKLMQDWKKTVSTQKHKFKDDNKDYFGNEYFNYDGFFPGYYKTNPKVLFIGREARYASGCDFIDKMIKLFKNNNMNRNIFWRRIFCMYNIIKNNGSIDKNITADQIAKSMVEENNYGFAVMNISKYSNDSKTGSSRDKKLMNWCLEDSKLDQRNFVKEELTILEPDLIITANLWDGTINEEYMEKCFGESESKIVQSGKVSIRRIKLENRAIKLIDLYHFSRRGVKDMDYFYKPISKLLK
jgi:hypothetical protein